MQIKIIMFFIIQIRPFKYLGNSGVTQANKWEEIRHKFMEYKRNLHETNFIVPTVRTLQRQLATAIKKLFVEEILKEGMAFELYNIMRFRIH